MPDVLTGTWYWTLLLKDYLLGAREARLLLPVGLFWRTTALDLEALCLLVLRCCWRRRAWSPTKEILKFLALSRPVVLAGMPRETPILGGISEWPALCIYFGTRACPSAACRSIEWMAFRLSRTYPGFMIPPSFADFSR